MFSYSLRIPENFENSLSGAIRKYTSCVCCGPIVGAARAIGTWKYKRNASLNFGVGAKEISEE